MMKVSWIGNASVMIRTRQTTLLFDPYNQPYHPEFVKFRPEELENVDAILITHPHLDHFGDIGSFCRETRCPVYVCKRGIEIASAQKLDLQRFQEVKPQDTIRIKDLIVRVHQGRHCQLETRQLPAILKRIHSKDDLSAGLHLLHQQLFTNRIGEKDIDTYEILDGQKAVMLMGSANIFPQDPGLFFADLMVYPYQGRIEMKEYSKAILAFYEPKKVMLSHFDNAFPPVTVRMDTAAFRQEMKKEKPDLEIIEPVRGVWYSV